MYGKVRHVLRSMYGKLKPSVRTNSDMTEWFECIIGTRQDCMLSPFLFAMYEFIDVLRSEECRGIQISERSVNVLLYADDMVLCANSVSDLHKQLNVYVLERYCTEWGHDCT